MEKLTNWEREFPQTDKEPLLSLAKAANFLDIAPLADAVCKKAARLLTSGELVSVRDLNEHIQDNIAQNVLPNALKSLAASGRISISEEQNLHNKIWTTFFRSDDWFEMLSRLPVEVNPVLIGASLGSSNSYVVLSSMDWTGDSKYEDPCLLPSINNHSLDERTYECTLESGEILNVYETLAPSTGSAVPRLEERLVQRKRYGQRSISVLHLRQPKLWKLVTDAIPNGGISVLCKNSLNPQSGEALKWFCHDSTVNPYQPFNNNFK